ncbi:uncharacterized protein BO97DRAFT_406906 [Aspergillus homomorphus CBS 101889]|uniref:Uncharacterized protein n=1 Tax=Aspergillus homomorphus (strain CBS 101889) TaxID=1450537 RepID=A0A395HR28_ASPHC|nr:hypothetical protein BO97DRAFT_406906 [Aspergillus homomorphus CBS 101889]RAL10411.1 hypothetical protein BO97DRAFT_406906 [Aspergillus homomorphus CBS 101889]
MTSSTDAEQTMQLALERFRVRMATANRKFIQDRVDEIEARGLASEEEKWRKMAEYRHIEPNEKETKFPQRLVDLPAAVDKVFPFPIDGVHPPRLRTDDAREQFLDMLQQVFQQQAEEWAAERGRETPGLLPRCDELNVFLKYAYAVEDPDFRLSAIPPFEPGLTLLSVEQAELAETQPEQYREQVREECAQVREFLESDGTGDLINKAIVGPWVEADDLEVKAGVITGTGYIGEYPHWYSTYLYCRQREDAVRDYAIPDAPNIRNWAWRVVVLDDKGDFLAPSVIYGRKPRFDSIPEFLDWYCSWPDYLDARRIRSLRRHAVQCETDCESDCDMHIA